MERKHMSALSIYQSLSGGTKPQVQANAAPAKKIKQKENGIQPNKKSNKKKRMKPLKSSMRLSSSDEEKSKAKDCETHNGEGFDGPALDVLLTDLEKVNNSRERANRLFQWLIHPVQDKSFFRENWEKKPILIQRQNPDYYKGLFSTAEFDCILRNNDVQYGVNLDVTSYTNGKRETHNPPGRALPYTLWDFYESGCSLRMLNPQAFSSTVWQVLSILQEKFGSMAGANVYLTPARTQGFAPHYDDIEAFILQLEGKKHWRVYNPRSEDEVLPLVSSPNFSQDEIGQPIMDVVLEAGDLLYFPRGFIHQDDCLPDTHSLHLTVSSFQRNSWGDLLLKLMPAALETAMEEDVEFRKGLPLDYLQFMGVQNSEKEDPRRDKFIACVEGLMKKLVDYAPVDAAVDQKAKDFLHDCLPPVLSAEEKASSVYGAPARWGDGEALGVTVQLKGQTQIRLLGAGAARLCGDGDTVTLFYTTENSRVYHKEEPKSIEMKAEHIDAMEFLIHSYPKFVSVACLPCETVEAKMSLAELLFEKGLIHTAEPLTAE
ncbi:bifunctional lysine-specific demethylase and histidyl-hydroxylase NO66-like isoform X2 [Sinocyclocheilus anshuiensis]|uniref:bifunctional lysine-specific demethylase and histidyl-hydroxylase NO66-like isoform X2 n=1 Tax=Sinocyclocheilus anshuiensis TaxID=1608454 RepID=UPI0007BAC6C0|nr:PREDICTED: bifunctional lysine-specific demethylase and histidyl-hydroxylase NO66-like isoform X2 [Sinocyclocheilus anshuiensis]